MLEVSHLSLCHHLVNPLPNSSGYWSLPALGIVFVGKESPGHYLLEGVTCRHGGTGNDGMIRISQGHLLASRENNSYSRASQGSG
jgi:hypothetical protein